MTRADEIALGAAIQEACRPDKYTELVRFFSPDFDALCRKEAEGERLAAITPQPFKH